MRDTLPRHFAVESGIPTPLRGKSGHHCKYPYASMKVGDSFLVPYTNGKHNEADVKRVKAAVYGYAQYNVGYRFSVRSMSNGIRVWRVEDSRIKQQQEAQALANDITDGALE